MGFGSLFAGIDPELRVRYFDARNTPHAVSECSSARSTFEPPPLILQETVAVLVELYRRAGSRKVRAVGHGSGGVGLGV